MRSLYNYKGCIALVTGNAYDGEQLCELRDRFGFDYVFIKVRFAQAKRYT